MSSFLTKFKNFFISLKKHPIRTLLILLVLAIVIFLGFSTFNKQTAQPQYQTAQAEIGTLIQSVTASGTVSSGNSLNITTQASGIIDHVYVKNGDLVTQGQKVADMTLDLDSQQRQAAALTSYQSALTAVKNAQNNLRADQASLDLTLDNIHQFQYGNGGFSNIGTPNETMTQRSQRTSSQVAVDKDNDAINNAQNQVNSSWLAYEQASAVIIAPQAGVINNLIITPGLQITGASNSSSSVLSSQKLGSIVISQGQVQATVNLSEIDAPTVSPNQKVTLTLDSFPDKTFTGKVLAIDTNGVVASGVTTYGATVSIDSPPPNIYPNMAVTAKIITSVKNDVVLVPNGAVQTANGQTTVRELQNGQIVNIPVEVGGSNDTQTEITSGINDGETVVTGVTSSAATRTTGGTSPFGVIGGRGGFGGGAVIRGGGRAGGG